MKNTTMNSEIPESVTLGLCLATKIPNEKNESTTAYLFYDQGNNNN